jgi:hypothetical protein
MRLSKPCQVPLKALLPLPFLNLPLHDRRVGAKLKALSIPKPEVVIGLAFEEFDALGFERGVEVVKGFLEELGKK